MNKKLLLQALNFTSSFETHKNHSFILLFMTKYKVIFDRNLCIGALSCFGVNPKRFQLAQDAKVDLVGGTFNQTTQKC